MRPATPGRIYGSVDLALDCAEDALERSGFQVQGEDIGAGSYQRNAPGRRARELLGRQWTTNEIAYVGIVTVLVDSTPTYRMSAWGFTTAVDGTSKSSVLHETGISAVVNRCGATR
jgi:hypothetical protein